MLSNGPLLLLYYRIFDIQFFDWMRILLLYSIHLSHQYFGIFCLSGTLLFSFPFICISFMHLWFSETIFSFVLRYDRYWISLVLLPWLWYLFLFSFDSFIIQDKSRFVNTFFKCFISIQNLFIYSYCFFNIFYFLDYFANIQNRKSRELQLPFIIFMKIILSMKIFLVKKYFW